MPALECRSSKGWGRVPMPDGQDSPNCDFCRASGKQYPSSGVRLIFVAGYPFLRVCRKHEKEARKVWIDAGGTDPAATGNETGPEF